VAKRIGQSSEGLLHFVENEEDDRERLREELRYFNTEAKRISELVSRTTDLTRAFSREDFQSNALVEEIGIHLFSTTEQNGAVSNSYKHRLFSFRLPTVGSIFRVYKLVLPHPQLKNPVTLRFIFQLEENVRGFFFSLPWMDYVVRSFKWLNLAVNPTLTLPRIEQKARQIRGATDV
jgi:hypothetical protein